MNTSEDGVEGGSEERDEGETVEREEGDGVVEDAVRTTRERRGQETVTPRDSGRGGRKGRRNKGGDASGRRNGMRKRIRDWVARAGSAGKKWRARGTWDGMGWDKR